MNKSNSYRCYAAAAERFPSARNSRWRNYDFVRNGGIPEITKKAKAIRIHSAGDFFNQQYFDMWMKIAIDNPDVEFWAYTKSVNYWVARLDEIPANITLTASYGGKFDNLIHKHNLKHVKVIKSIDDAKGDLPIDKNDDMARDANINSFYLLDNHNPKNKKKQK